MGKKADDGGVVGHMSLTYFVKNYVKPFEDNPKVLEVPFIALQKDGWKYDAGQQRFILERVKESDEG